MASGRILMAAGLSAALVASVWVGGAIYTKSKATAEFSSWLEQLNLDLGTHGVKLVANSRYDGLFGNGYSIEAVLPDIQNKLLNVNFSYGFANYASSIELDENVYAGLRNLGDEGQRIAESLKSVSESILIRKSLLSGSLRLHAVWPHGSAKSSGKQKGAWSWGDVEISAKVSRNAGKAEFSVPHVTYAGESSEGNLFMASADGIVMNAHSECSDDAVCSVGQDLSVDSFVLDDLSVKNTRFGWSVKNIDLGAMVKSWCGVKLNLDNIISDELRECILKNGYKQDYSAVGEGFSAEAGIETNIGGADGSIKAAILVGTHAHAADINDIAKATSGVLEARLNRGLLQFVPEQNRAEATALFGLLAAGQDTVNIKVECASVADLNSCSVNGLPVSQFLSGSSF